MKEKTTKKHSAAKKLIPATCMLLVSALTLVSSTYAWFTMSREVEVQNIKLTASVPEDLQISLGELDTTDGSGNGYMNNYGNIVKASGANANNGRAKQPRDVAEDWANTVDVSKYYKLGTIIPASSTDGQDIFFTPDAAGVGKELKTGAKFYKAVDNATVEPDTTTAASGTDEHTSTYETTLHAITGKTTAEITDSWTPALATAYDKTYDAGYFVDIPVWIRSGAKEDVTLSVDAYVTTNSTIDGDDLYLAARAVILDENKANTSKLLEIKKNSFSNLESIVDFMDTTNASGEAVASIDGSNLPTYGTVTHYAGEKLNSGATNTFKIASAGNNNYGAATKVWIRVWLEGEDPNCWNDNAGQDFNICIKFTKDDLTPRTSELGEALAPSNANYPKANSWTDVPNTGANSLKIGDTVSVTGTIKDANDSTHTATVAIAMTYTYNGTTWERTDGSYPGVTIYANGENTPYANESAFVGYLGNHYTTKASIATATTITDTAP